MIKVTFNSKAHWMEISTDGKKSQTYTDVMTIKNNDHGGYYEILQRQINDSVAPLFRLPMNSTIVEYQHSVNE